MEPARLESERDRAVGEAAAAERDTEVACQGISNLEARLGYKE
jgi:hypothetical protein